MNIYSLEEEIRTFEELMGCTVCLHSFNTVFFHGNISLVDPRRVSHRKTHPERCGREKRSYCIEHCMQNLKHRMEAAPDRDLFAVHCRNGCFELASPVYRGGRCVLTVFAGLLDPEEKIKVRKIGRILPIFAAGLEARAHRLSLLNKVSQNTYSERIHDFIELHYAEDISTADAARALCVSVSRLCHILKENGQGSFSRILTEERIYHAKQFLKHADPDLSLYEVALLCGFRSYEHFSRTFRRETSFSPAQWRKKYIVPLR